MKNTINYRGYTGSVEFSEADGVFFGQVLGIKALISYEGTNAATLIEDFHAAVDEYFAVCEETGTAPEQAYKGSFNVRISTELHRRAAIAAAEQSTSLNKFVENALRYAVKAAAV